MKLKQHIEIPRQLWVDILHTGSSAICDPPVTDTDIDFVIHSKRPTDLFDWLKIHGYDDCKGEDEAYDAGAGSAFYAVRKGQINIIIVGSEIAYLRWSQATELATRFNLTDKEDRIALFNAIRSPIQDVGDLFF